MIAAMSSSLTNSLTSRIHVSTCAFWSKPFLPVIFQRLNVFYGKSNQIFSEICFYIIKAKNDSCAPLFVRNLIKDPVCRTHTRLRIAGHLYILDKITLLVHKESYAPLQSLPKFHPQQASSMLTMQLVGLVLLVLLIFLIRYLLHDDLRFVQHILQT